jgi:ABC-type cobalamin/Fe3+-siderophores transport system ATPase subunit
MKISLPTKKGESNPITIEASSIVIIGANGSGKTRFGSKIEENHLDNTLRIAAQKSLSMPKEVSPKSKEKAQNDFWYGHTNEDIKWLQRHGKLLGRWQNDFNTSLLNDFDKLLVLLHTEEYEESLRYKEGEIPRPTTKLDRLQILWEDVLPHRKLIKRAGTIETFPTNNPSQKYNSSQMSDGERVIFYFIGEVLCCKANSIIIIDEPEVHLHKSISTRLWDLVENERPDCTFIYLTHDIEFASSRASSLKIWTKSYEGNDVWDYEVLTNDLPMPEQMFLEIIGSRKPILFIEGDKTSIDKKILEQIYSTFTVKQIGGCERIINSTKAFNDLTSFHSIIAYGLVDRDRRTDEEIEHIKNPNIWIVKLAEMENLLLLEEIVKTIAEFMKKNPEEVFNNVKNNILSFFETEKETQALEHTISRIDRIFKTATNNKTIKSVSDLDSQLNHFWTQQDFKALYKSILDKFEAFLVSKDYLAILTVFNNKGIINKSNVARLCDLNEKNNAYLNLVTSIIRENGAAGQTIRKAVDSMINK